MPQRIKMLIQTNADANHNKFYEVTLEDDGNVKARWGRVGSAGQSGSKGQGERAFEAAVRAKTSSGYQEVAIMVAETATGQPQASLAELAKREVLGQANDPALVALIDRLVAINRHQLQAASGGQIQIIDGQVRTALGLITLSSVSRARAQLEDLQALVRRHDTGSAYSRALEDYLMLVPQRIPAQRGWAPEFFTTFTDFTKQNDLLDQLESSIKLAEATPPPPPSSQAAPVERVFGYGLSVCEDAKIIKRIEKFYKASSNSMHVSAKLKLKRVYTLTNPAALEAFNRTVKAMDGRGSPGSNVKQFWHGTRPHNVLSIFKSGLIIAKSGTSIAITGRLFGNGLYFSDQSTKALNYAYGYWDRTGGYDNNCFMFLCDVAMGRSHVPQLSPNTMINGDRRKEGYDSCFAQAGTSGVRNNEMIVYTTDQVFLRYLCEFDL